MSGFLDHLITHKNPWIGFTTALLIGGAVGVFVGGIVLLFGFLFALTKGLILVPFLTTALVVIALEYLRFKEKESE